MPPPLTWSVRPASPADEGFFSRLYATTRADELAATGWSAAQQDAFLQSQFAARKFAYRNAFPGADTTVIVLGRTPIGALIVHRTAGEIRLVDIALLPSHRRHGIGTEVLRQLQREAEAAALPLRLHVVKGSPAFGLYQRIGFAPVGHTPTHLALEWLPPARSG